MAWKDQKRKLHFGVSDTGSWRSQESRLFITGVPKLRNAKRRNPETGTSTKTPFQEFRTGKSKVSDTGSWRSQESRLFISGVPKLRNVKRRNPETGTSTKTPFRSFGYRELEVSRTLTTRMPKTTKCETPKYVDLTPFRSFGYRELEESRKQLATGIRDMRNAEMPKREMRNACSELAPGHNLWSHRRRLKGGASTKLISIS
jgi:hypothetical protein